MKNYILIIFLSLSIFTLNSQTSDTEEPESYILTKEGAKIEIASNSRIYYTKATIEYLIEINPSEKKKKDIDYPKGYFKKKASIKSKHIEKIVDGDKTYFPFVDDKKTKIFRDIAMSNEYILGTYVSRYSSTTSSSKKLKDSFLWNYVIFDIDYNIIKQGKIYNPIYILDNEEKLEELKTNIAEIKEYFGDCLGRDDDLFDLIKIKDFKSKEKFSLEKFSLEKFSDNEYKKYYFKYRQYFRLKFLHYQNQIDCF